MPRSKPRNSKDHGEVTTPLLVLDVIDNCLKDMLRTFPAKELTPEEVEHWHKDLGVFPQGAIEWAFDNWRRNGRFFPVYGDILDQCVTWQPPQVIRTNVCDAICRARHGKGYGWRDMYSAFEMMRQAVSEKRPIDSEAILQAIDAKRDGGAPEFRRVET